MNNQLLLEGRWLLTPVAAEQPDPVVVVQTTCNGFTTTITGAMNMAYTLPADKIVEVKISYKDANGNDASIDGAVSWETSDAEIVNAVPPANPEADNSHVVLMPGTKIGNCQITAKADADLGTGVRELVTPFDVTVVGGEAVTGTIEPVGEQQPKPQGARR